MFSVDEDGYIRVGQCTLDQIKLIHLVSGIFDEAAQVSESRDDDVEKRGYTELVTASVPAISTGWDWTMDMSGHAPMPQRLGTPYGNLMVVYADGHDIGSERSAHLLGEMVDRIPWQAEVLGSVGFGRA